MPRRNKGGNTEVLEGFREREESGKEDRGIERSPRRKIEEERNPGRKIEGLREVREER